MAQSLEARIKSGILSVRFDGGHWVKLAHGAVKVISTEDRGGPPRAGTITYRNEWGLVMTESFVMRAPRRLE